MHAPLLLGIETSNPSAQCGAGVAFARLDTGRLHVLGSEAVGTSPPKAGRADDMLASINALARRIGVAPRKIDRVCVSTGPGGYTGLRMAIVAAQMIAECAGAVCVGVPTAIAAARRTLPKDDAFAVCLASKAETTYARHFDGAGRPLDEGRIVTAADVASMRVRTVIADRFLPESIRDAAHARGCTIEPPVFDPIAVLEASLDIEPVDPVHLRVVYPREPNAVTQWWARR